MVTSGNTEDSVIEHEVGHAAGLLYLGFGVAYIRIWPDHGEHSGRTQQRMSENDMPRYHRIVAFLCGFRAEQEDLCEELERAIDFKNARMLAREYLDAESGFAPEVNDLISRAWHDAGLILGRTAGFRAAATARLRELKPHNGTNLEVEDLWDGSAGYAITFGEAHGKNHVASLTLDGEPAGSFRYAVEEGTADVTRVVLVQADTPDHMRGHGHAHRLLISIRDSYDHPVLVDGASSNTEEGDLLLVALRRHNTIHATGCYFAGNRCVCVHPND